MTKFNTYAVSNGPVTHFYKPSIAAATVPVTLTTGAAAPETGVAVVGGWGCLIQCSEDAGIKQGTADTVTIADIDEDGVIQLMAGAWYPLILDKTTTHISHIQRSRAGKLNIIYVQKFEES